MNPTIQLEDAIFFTALNLPDLEQRKGYLDHACAGNPGLRAAVEELLAGQGGAEHFFAKGRSALHLLPDEFPADADCLKEMGFLDEQIGTRIVCYKILQRIGEGGCGCVYMA